MSHAVIRSEQQIEALGDEFQKLDAAYSLREGYGVTFGMFVEKPWYYRHLTELLEDGGMRPLTRRQRIAAMKADRDLLRSQSRERLQGGEIFEPLHHHRHPTGGHLEFNRRLRP